jgi:hypothetical protein
LSLRAHYLLADVQLHDVWRADLVDGGPGRTMEDVRRFFTAQTATSANAAVRLLFAIRSLLGKTFGWDSDQNRWAEEYYSRRLSAEDRAQTLVAPGTPDGPFRTVYVFENEALSEIRNATVHAFSCLALRPVTTGYWLYWAIYVKPISPLTARYMKLIDPFRRAVVYPAVIRRVEFAWRTAFAEHG